MAIAILLFAFDFAMNKKPVKFLLLVWLASTFHNSSWFFIIAYPLANINNIYKADKKMWYYIGGGLIVIGITFFFPKVLNVLLKIFPKYSYYVGGASMDGNPRLAIFLKIIVFSLLVVISNMFFHVKDIKQSRYLDIMQNYSLLNICTLIIASNSTALVRLCGIYFIYPLVTYSDQFAFAKKHRIKDAVIIETLTIILFYIYGYIIVLMKTPEWISTYPYTFYWQ